MWNRKYSAIAVLSVGILLFATSPATAKTPTSAENARSAAGQIRRAVERGDSAGFTGIELRQGSVRLWYKGNPPPSMRSVIERAAKVAPVELMPAKYSLAELQAASERMTQHLRAHPGGAAHLVSIPVDGSGLIVGADPVALSTQSPQLPDVGVPVRVIGQNRTAQYGRHNDFAPFYGGGAMQRVGGGGCAAGFGVRMGSTPYLLTAAHCGYPGQMWLNGDGTQWLGIATHEDVNSDLMLIRASAGAYVFTGVGTSGAAGHVSGWDWVYTGEELCQSGPVTTWLCGHVVQDAGNVTQCNYDEFGHWECVTGLVWSIQEDGRQASTFGDSGGPVVLPTPSGLIAKGTIYGGNGAHMFWQDFATARQIFGIEPIT